jgi:hypothetical protein
VKRKKKRLKQKGAAMILTICILAVVVVLCMILLLAASVVMKTATGERSEEQCRILSVSLSKEMEQQLCSSEYQFTSQKQENAARDQQTLWFFVKKGMSAGTWRYYDDSKQNHTAGSTFRIFDLSTASWGSDGKNPVSAVGADQITATMYWETDDEETEKASDEAVLTIGVFSSCGGQSCTVTSRYSLSLTSQSGGYEQWSWNLIRRE